MNSHTGLPQPFDLVAKALGCSPTSLSIDSARYRDHGWDSFGHLSVILALEEAYGIRIDDDGVQKYTSMRAIQELYKQRSATG
jgi:acyl carrier protein